MKKEKTVSLCMIVKNEENYLRRCLDSVKHLVDEIIIVDTGSTDKTIEIAKEFNADIFHYKWDNHFANARNESLKHATKDWILLMDADDELNQEDTDKFIQLINTSKKDGHYFKTTSYVGDHPGKDMVYNLNIRLIRNINKYQFSGAIHEQIVNLQGPMDYHQFTTEDIEIFHYGYLFHVADEKEKRKRNITIIEKELKKDPLNGFHKFNLGNEYFALNNQEKALCLFNDVYKNLDFNTGYSSKLVIRRIMCFDELKQYDKALQAIKEGLKAYPDFTDIEFIRGWIYLKQKRYTLAIDSFNTCLKMGPPSIKIVFLNGCGTYRPYEALGEIYFQLEDYNRALVSYKQALNDNPKLITPLYKIASILNKTYSDKHFVSYKMNQFFNLNHTPNLILLAKILISERLDAIALGYLELALEKEPDDQNIKFLKAKALCHLKKYKEANDLFTQVSMIERLHYQFLIALINKKDTTHIIKQINDEDEEVTTAVISQFNDIHKGIGTNYLEKINAKKALHLTIQLFEELLIVQEFSLFEKLLPVLNLIESKYVLIDLAKLYYRYDYKQLAIEEIFRSVKEFDLIDIECIHILHKESDAL